MNFNVNDLLQLINLGDVTYVVLLFVNSLPTLCSSEPRWNSNALDSFQCSNYLCTCKQQQKAPALAKIEGGRPSYKKSRVKLKRTQTREFCKFCHWHWGTWWANMSTVIPLSVASLGLSQALETTDMRTMKRRVKVWCWRSKLCFPFFTLVQQLILTVHIKRYAPLKTGRLQVSLDKMLLLWSKSVCKEYFFLLLQQVVYYSKHIIYKPELYLHNFKNEVNY